MKFSYCYLPSEHLLSWSEFVWKKRLYEICVLSTVKKYVYILKTTLWTVLQPLKQCWNQLQLLCMNSARMLTKIAKGEGRNLAYMVSKFVHFRPFCRWCSEKFCQELKLPDASNDLSPIRQCHDKAYHFSLFWSNMSMD